MTRETPNRNRPTLRRFTQSARAAGPAAVVIGALVLVGWLQRLISLRLEMKVLLMSGYTDEAIVHHGVLDAEVEFIQKPFSPAALCRRVRDVLDSNW